MVTANRVLSMLFLISTFPLSFRVCVCVCVCGWVGVCRRHETKHTQVDDVLEEEKQDKIVSKLHEILRPFLLRRLKKVTCEDWVGPDWIGSGGQTA